MESWQKARSELEHFLKEQPENYSLMADLALTTMCLGDRAVALGLSEQAMNAVPIEKDPVDGPGRMEVFARVTALAGESDRAMAALRKLFSVAYQGPLAGRTPLTPALLRSDPMFDSLRNNPRFQELAVSTSKANDEP